MTRILLVLGVLFLWAPVVLLALYAFSASREPFEWGGLSLRWFVALAGNERVLEAAWLSVRIAAASATLATLLGGVLGWVLARHGPFRGRALFGALAGAPLVLPEVVTGLALLLVFVGMQTLFGWPAQRGAGTVLVAHASLGAAYAGVLIQSRIAALDPRLEEAAMGLGASRLAVLRTVTLPMLAPGLGAAWTLAFVLSLDDVVLASFVSGPGGTTLPVFLFSQLRLGMTPEANALAVVTLGIAGLLLAGFAWFRRRA
ncbi:ABC transporter permease [Sabulicella glaciei]|uniref:ABC transporter permease subunit n=1 Tax=Sabulicella glaciei TaxID=2984948 RepID=A0ABT3NW13_9PROT|nr:ABC transporter permease subunit [Roseococcus sp. MDT2-1-1]